MTGRKQFDPEVATAVAVRVFWERGYSAVSIADLQEAMGIGRASLYDTFGGKEQLFLRTLRMYTSTYGPPVLEAFAANRDDALAAIDVIFEATLARMSDPSLPQGCLVAQSAAELGALPPASRTAVQDLVSAQVASIDAALTRDLAAGRLRQGVDPYTLAVSIAAAVHSLSIMDRSGIALPVLTSVSRRFVQDLARSFPGATVDPD